MTGVVASRAADDYRREAPPIKFDELFNYLDEDLKTMYCSELVWRAYKAAGVNLVPTPTQRTWEDVKQFVKSNPKRLIEAFEREKGPIRHRKVVRLREKDTPKAWRLIGKGATRYVVQELKKKRHSLKFIRPDDLANSALVEKISE
jgi:hypothetical protein